MSFTSDDAIRLCSHLAAACWPGRELRVWAEGTAAGITDGHGHVVLAAEGSTLRRAKFRLAAKLCQDVASLCVQNAGMSMARKRRGAK